MFKGKLSEYFYNFQLGDTITKFGSLVGHVWAYSIQLLI